MGLVAIARRLSPVTVVALGLTLLVSLLLFLFASFCPLTRFLQPVRFVAVYLNLGALLTGCAIAGVSRGLRFPRFVSVAAYAIVCGVLVAAVAFFGQRLTPPQDAVALIDFIQHRTLENDRILLEAAWPYAQFGKILPAITHREVISTTFPDVDDPIEFHSYRLFGRSTESVHRSGSRGSGAVQRQLGDCPLPALARILPEDRGRTRPSAGPYEAFAVGGGHSRFLVGTGEVLAGVNRLELRNVGSPQDYVVIRYRYHPGWVCDGPSTIEPFPTPDDSGGLLPNPSPRAHDRAAVRPGPSLARSLAGRLPRGAGAAEGALTTRRRGEIVIAGPLETGLLPRLFRETAGTTS